MMHWIDYIIVILSIAAAIVVGMYFAHKQKDTSQYFAGGGKIPAWAVGISIFATLISSVTFLAYPGAAYADNWILLVQGLMVPIVLLALVGIIVPLFRKVIRLSTYEYFERRFGLFARLYSSFAFTLGHFSKAGTVFFLVSMALATFLDINIYSIVLVLGVTIIILTLFGGMEAIVWMDVAQGFLLIGGGIICIGILMFGIEGGPAETFRIASEYNKIRSLRLGPDAADVHRDGAQRHLLRLAEIWHRPDHRAALSGCQERPRGEEGGVHRRADVGTHLGTVHVHRHGTVCLLPCRGRAPLA